MTQHKVIADDSLSAMDEISRVLGKEAVIIKTQRINGKIEILGSNNIEDIASSNAKKINKQKSNFSHLFSNHNLKKDQQNRQFSSIIENKNMETDIKSEKIDEYKNAKLINNFVDIETFSNFTNKIENLLKNMIVSDIDEFSNFKNKSLTIELLKKGFSKKIVSEFQEKIISNEEIEDPELFFYHYLAKKLVLPFEDQVLNSDVIFLNGPTGSGKTTLCAKISSYILDNLFSSNEKDKLSILNFGPKSRVNSELLNFGRLLNLRVSSISSLDNLVKYIEENKQKTKLIIDISIENSEFTRYLEYLEKITLNKKYLNLLAIPSSTNKNMIKSTMKLYKNSFPTFALTKLDESQISAEELSIFAELEFKIGILSGSRSIIGSLAFAKSEVLAQYMKDIT